MNRPQNSGQGFGRNLAQGAVSSEQNRQAELAAKRAERREKSKARAEQARAVMAQRNPQGYETAQRRKSDLAMLQQQRQAGQQQSVGNAASRMSDGSVGAAGMRAFGGGAVPQAPGAGLVGSAMQGATPQQPFNPFN